MSLSKFFSHPGYENLGPDEALRPLHSTQASLTQELWERDYRPALERRWRRSLGSPAYTTNDYPSAATKLAECHGPDFVASLWSQPTGPDQSQKVILLQPLRPPVTPAPGAVIPFYQPETVAGFEPDAHLHGLKELSTEAYAPGEDRCFGRHLVRLGFTVACVEAFPFNTVPDPETGRKFDHWQRAADKILSDHPEWTGLGKLIHDTSRAVDLLLAQPGLDPQQVVVMGHSLGGKMAFYTGAMDARITAVVASDFGLPWDSTNWTADWYWGTTVPGHDPEAAHHELLALLAPRPFFLIAGQTDSRRSWQYMEKARNVYTLYHAAHHLGGIDHASGHAPTLAALEVAYAWLRERFHLPRQSWRS